MPLDNVNVYLMYNKSLYYFLFLIQGWWKNCDMPGYKRISVNRIRCPSEIKANDVIKMELNLEDEDNRWQHTSKSCHVRSEFW